jgi:hypothetical protein
MLSINTNQINTRINMIFKIADADNSRYLLFNTAFLPDIEHWNKFISGDSPKIGNKLLYECSKSWSYENVINLLNYYLSKCGMNYKGLSITLNNYIDMYKIAQDIEDTTIQESVKSFIECKITCGFNEEKIRNRVICTSELIKNVFNCYGLGSDANGVVTIIGNNDTCFLENIDKETDDKKYTVATADGGSIYNHNYELKEVHVTEIKKLYNFIEENPELFDMCKVVIGFCINIIGLDLEAPKKYTMKDLIRFNEWISGRYDSL